MLHSLIDSIEIKSKETNKTVLLIKSKDFQIFQIEFPTNELCQSVYASLESLINIGKPELNDSITCI